jgi:hypothetical protein
MVAADAAAQNPNESSDQQRSAVVGASGEAILATGGLGGHQRNK